MKGIMVKVYDNEWDIIKRVAEESGLDTPTAYVRRIVRSIIRCANKENDADVMVHVTNLRELLAYVDDKKFGSIESFATFSMASVMSRNPSAEMRKSRKTADLTSE